MMTMIILLLLYFSASHFSDTPHHGFKMCRHVLTGLGNLDVIMTAIRQSAIRTFGLRIKQFLTASNIELITFWKHLLILSYHLGVSNLRWLCWIWCIWKKIEQMHRFNIPAALHGNTRQVPWLHSCLYRWFTGWKCCGLCYSFPIKHRNFHEIA